MLIEFDEVVAHDDRALHKEATHAQSIGAHFLDLLDHLGDTDLDADVVHFVSVVRADDVDEVLADVVHVAFDSRENKLALRGALTRFGHVWFQICDGSLHCFGALQNERQLHAT